ncbi:MAG: ABC transporter permease [Bacteroidales bacterium]
MLKSIIKHSVRSFKRQKGYFIINLLGLALGLASSLLITVFVIHEFSYDKFNEKGDRIYKLILNGKIGGQEVTVSSTAAVIAPTMKRDFPEVEKFCRINQMGVTNLRYNNRNFEERSYFEADSTFFQLFSIPLIHGSAEDVLNEPHKMVISRSTALRIFGDEDPIDKSIQVGTDETYYVVSGIMEDMPENCHFNANIILSFMTNPRSANPIWLNNSFDTYLLLYPNADPVALEEKFPAMVRENVGPEVIQFMGISMDEFESAGNKYRFFLQPLFRIHLDPTVDQPMKPATDPKYLIIFGSVALLIILIASINFMNLSTAQATKRSREVGMKKVSGSSRMMLVTQFLAESVILALLALIVAVVLVKLSLPLFNDLLNASFGFSLFGNWYTIFLLIGATIFVGLLAGSYPAFYLSSISPSVIFRNNNSKRSLNGRLRSVLVVFQFTASIILIIGTTIMYRQISYMLNKDVGYNKEQLLVISRAGALDSRVEAFRTR